MGLHHLLSHDGQQLAEISVYSHLHQNETGNVCRVREGKLGCSLKPQLTSVSVNVRTMSGIGAHKTGIFGSIKTPIVYIKPNPGP